VDFWGEFTEIALIDDEVCRLEESVFVIEDTADIKR